MSIDPTTLPACTQEDGSDPGQIFPCHWDASLMGNGIGDSFVMLDQSTYVYDDAAVQAQHEPAVSPANDVDPALIAAMDNAQAAPQATAQVLASPPAPELAHTGPTDPIMWVAAALMVTIGAVLLPVGKRGRRRSS